MRRFLALWALLFPAYLVAAGLASWLVLGLLDVTYEAFVAWLLVPVAQSAVIAASGRRGSLLPAGRPPLAATLAVALAAVSVAAGLLRPLDARIGFLGAGSFQPLLPRLLALLAGAALLVAATRVRDGRAPLALPGLVLLALGADAARPWIAGLPAALLPRLGVLPRGLAVYGALLALVFAGGLAAQRRLEARSPWSAHLLGASLAFLFAALQGALLQLFLHPWLERPYSLLVPAAVSLSAGLAAAAGLAAVNAGREAA